MIAEDILFDKPVRCTIYVVLPIGSKKDNKGIFDLEDIESVYLADYRPNKENDYKTVLISGIADYLGGSTAQFCNIECIYFDEKKPLKPAKEYYEWHYGR